MNKFFNAALLFFLFPTMALTIIVGFDLPFDFLKTTGKYLPYRGEAFIALGSIMLFFVVRRSIKRWMALHVVNQTERFHWSGNVSMERMKRVIVYSILEISVYCAVAFGLIQVSKEAFFPAMSLVIAAIDGLVFLMVGGFGKKFKVGLSSKAVIVGEREVVLLYFSGLRKVEIFQQTIFFDYIKGLQLSFPVNCIEEKDKDEFFSALNQVIDKEKVFVTEKR